MSRETEGVSTPPETSHSDEFDYTRFRCPRSHEHDGAGCLEDGCPCPIGPPATRLYEAHFLAREDDVRTEYEKGFEAGHEQAMEDIDALVEAAQREYGTKGWNAAASMVRALIAQTSGDFISVFDLDAMFQAAEDEEGSSDD